MDEELEESSTPLLPDLSDGLSKRLPDLAKMVAQVQCPVCYETLRNPEMTTNGCGHNFCSMCVRRYLVYKQQCPSCFQSLLESQLKPNRVLTDIIESLGNLLPKLEEIVSNSAPPVGKNVSERGKEEAPKMARPASLSSQSESESTVVTVVNSSRNDSVNSEGPSSQDGDRVPCPVCQVRVLQKNVNLHLDRCLAEQRGELGPASTSTNLEMKSPTQSTKSPAIFKTLKPMKQPIFHILKDAALKKLLKEQGLETKGDRKTLEKRFRNFVVLWNSQVNSAKPMSRLQMVMKIKRDETNLKTSATAASSSNNSLLNFDRNSDVKTIESKQKAYVEKNKSHFETLIAQARKNKESKSKPAQTAAPAQPSMSTCNDGDLQAIPMSQDQPTASTEKVKAKTHSISDSESSEDLFADNSFSVQEEPPSPKFGMASASTSTPKRKIQEDEDGDHMSPSFKRVKKTTATTTPRKANDSLTSTKVPCPICCIEVPSSLIQPHVERCLERQETQPRQVRQAKNEVTDNAHNTDDGEETDLEMFNSTPDIIVEPSPPKSKSGDKKERSALESDEKENGGKRKQKNPKSDSPTLATRTRTRRGAAKLKQLS